mgnify:FL=1
MTPTGPHRYTEEAGKDVNGRYMIICRDCKTDAHAYTVLEAYDDLAVTACEPNCENCKSLRHSYDGKPAVPIGGTCNIILHICSNDGNRWWQSNTYYHLWNQVTSSREWEGLQKELRSPSNRQGLGW